MFTGAYSDTAGGASRLIDETESIGQKTRQTIARLPRQKTSSPSEDAAGLSARGLSKRLGITHPVVGKMKNRGADIFAAWSKKLDPDGLAWELRGDKYYPLKSQ